MIYLHNLKKKTYKVNANRVERSHAVQGSDLAVYILPLDR